MFEYIGQKYEEGQGSKEEDLGGTDDNTHAQYSSDTDQKTDEKKACLSPRSDQSDQSDQNVIKEEIWHCDHSGCLFSCRSRWDFKVHLGNVHHMSWEDQDVHSTPGAS